jgi:hypothetical protein
MIFPDMPKRQHWWDKHTEPVSPVEVENHPAQVQETMPVSVTAEEWFAKHFPDTVVTALPSHRETFDWRKDPKGTAEFAALCGFLIAWVAYWYQVSH